ncbi:MAG: hypothetical protein WDZ59_09700 [Pirellulales bacterium]
MVRKAIRTSELVDPRYLEAGIARLCELCFAEFVAEAWYEHNWGAADSLFP